MLGLHHPLFGGLELLLLLALGLGQGFGGVRLSGRLARNRKHLLRLALGHLRLCPCLCKFLSQPPKPSVQRNVLRPQTRPFSRVRHRNSWA